MVCPPVRGDNPRALASGLSPVQSGNHGIFILYHLYISVDLAHYELFRTKVGMDGINCFCFWSLPLELTAKKNLSKYLSIFICYFCHCCII